MLYVNRYPTSSPAMPERVVATAERTVGRSADSRIVRIPPTWGTESFGLGARVRLSLTDTGAIVVEPVSQGA